MCRSGDAAVSATVPVPVALHELAQRWEDAGRPAQSPIAWPRRSWELYFPEHLDLLNRLPDLISRDDVRRLAVDAAVHDHHALEAFVASMVWGYGNVGYGRWRTRRVLVTNPHAAEALRYAAHLQTTSGAVESYRSLANAGRLKHLGPAFGTKFLHFVPQSPDANPALILDAIVAAAIAAVSGIRISPVVWRTSTYERYLSLIVGWSEALSVEPAEVEMLLFVSRSPGQWTEAWVHDKPT